MVHAVEPKRDCPHCLDENLVHDDYSECADALFGPCVDCGSAKENWICLSCKKVFCSRYVEGHMSEHGEASGHHIVLSFSDLSMWCYACESYVIHHRLKAPRDFFYKIKFGEDPPVPAGESSGSAEEQQPPSTAGGSSSSSSDITVNTTTAAPPAAPFEIRVPKHTPPPPRPAPPVREFDAVTSLEDVAKLIKEKKCTNVLVLTGAGLSTAAGIPDFRTPGTGLYDNLQKYNLPRPTAVFELAFFRTNPDPFFALSKELTAAEYSPTRAHHFLRLLEDEGVLLRNYTQNIDGLEYKTGVKEDLVICCHGNYRTGHCMECRQEYNYEWMFERIQSGVTPKCEECADAVVKPDITMFGESLPNRFLRNVQADCEKCDLLIIMGTSLKVNPVASIPNFVDNIPRILINRNPGGVFEDPSKMRPTDLFWEGDCDDGCDLLAEHLGLKDKLDALCSSVQPEAKKVEESTTETASEKTPAAEPSA